MRGTLDAIPLHLPRSLLGFLEQHMLSDLGVVLDELQAVWGRALVLVRVIDEAGSCRRYKSNKGSVSTSHLSILGGDL